MQASAPSDRPATAFAATFAAVRERAGRSLLYIVLLCVSIAFLITAFNGGGLGPSMVYAFSIGICCWSLVDLLRLASAALADRLRRARGLPCIADGAIGWQSLLPVILIATLLGPPLGMKIADHLTGNRSPSLLDVGSINTRVTIVITLVATLVSVFVMSSLERLSNARAAAEAAQRQATESQLRLLQSQLEPHMLFNTLANLRVLIALDPARAQAMLDRLIAYLRATLNASRAGRHPLAAEFERVADYLALMAVRMGERLQVELDLPEDLRTLAVPPLLLQPLVENGIQHGLEPKVEGGRIEVRARRSGDRLAITVRDSGVGLGQAGASAGTGFGLTQVRERLATLYGERASFTIAADAGGGTLATLELPIE